MLSAGRKASSGPCSAAGVDHWVRVLDSAPAAPPIHRMTAQIRLGTQGWNYDAWVGPFYPVGTRSADYLTVYARAFDTVEVDSTFYAIPPARTIRGWFDRTPHDFVFALKLPQEITHEDRKSVV